MCSIACWRNRDIRILWLISACAARKSPHGAIVDPEGTAWPQTAVHMRRRSDVQASAPPRNRPSNRKGRTIVHRPKPTSKFGRRAAVVGRFAVVGKHAVLPRRIGGGERRRNNAGMSITVAIVSVLSRCRSTCAWPMFQCSLAIEAKRVWRRSPLQRSLCSNARAAVAFRRFTVGNSCGGPMGQLRL